MLISFLQMFPVNGLNIPPVLCIGRKVQPGGMRADREKKQETLITCHGGAAVTPQDVQYLLDKTKGLDGYVGGSTAERLPVEKSITAAVRDFKDVKLRSS